MWIHDFKNFMELKKLWHAITNIDAINSRHTKTYGVTKTYGQKKKSWITMKIYDTLLPNDMLCYHHMEDLVVISCKGWQYFQLTDKWD